MSRKKNLDINMMSQQTGVPVIAIKAALGIPLGGECKATTIKKAEEVFDKTDPGSEKEHLSLKKWIDLVVTPEQARIVYDRVPSDSELLHFAFKKWEKLSREQIKLANTTEEIERVYNETPKYSSVRILALKEWIKIACTVDELVRIRDMAPVSSGVQQLALKKIAIVL